MKLRLINSRSAPKRRALVILADGFEEIEAVTPIDILRRAGIEVVVAGLDKTAVTGARGITVQADILLTEFTGRPDAVILPGGMPGATNLAASSAVKALLAEAEDGGGIIAAICAAPAVVLAPMGLLKGKQATCYPGMEEDFPDGAGYTGQGVTIDGRIITASGVGTAMEFSLALVEALAGRDIADEVAAKALIR